MSGDLALPGVSVLWPTEGEGHSEPPVSAAEPVASGSTKAMCSALSGRRCMESSSAVGAGAGVTWGDQLCCGCTVYGLMQAQVYTAQQLKVIPGSQCFVFTEPCGRW